MTWHPKKIVSTITSDVVAGGVKEHAILLKFEAHYLKIVDPLPLLLGWFLKFYLVLCSEVFPKTLELRVKLGFEVGKWFL